MYPVLKITKYFGRLYTRFGYNVTKYKLAFAWLIGGRSQHRPFLFQSLQRLSSGVQAGLIGGTGLAIAQAQRGQDRRPKDQTDGPATDGQQWISNRVKGDICHLAPGISELMLDLLDLLQNSYDKYVKTMSRRVADLESNLRKYGSTMSLNLADSDSYSLTDPGSKDIQQFRKDYRKTYQRVSEMIVGLDRFLLSAGDLGANTCVEKCQREIQEITRLLRELDQKIRMYENKVEMAEKHFRTKMRRTGNGSS